jgi:hypothetical protein
MEILIGWAVGMVTGYIGALIMEKLEVSIF